MPQIQNPEAVDIIREEAKLSLGDGFPQVLGNQVVPVMDMTPHHHKKAHICKTAFASNTTSANLYTTPTDQDFYLTALSLSVVKDATATSTESSIRVNIGSVTVRIATIIGFTLTAQNQTYALSFNNPVKIDRGTTFTVQNGTGTANINAIGTIYGYLN